MKADDYRGDCSRLSGHGFLKGFSAFLLWLPLLRDHVRAAEVDTRYNVILDCGRGTAVRDQLVKAVLICVETRNLLKKAIMTAYRQLNWYMGIKSTTLNDEREIGYPFELKDICPLKKRCMEHFTSKAKKIYDILTMHVTKSNFLANKSLMSVHD